MIQRRLPLERLARSLTMAPLWLLLLALGALSCERYEEPLPRRDRLNYPIGLALHPEGEYLYVVNSNFDSRYSPQLGGTVSVVDTDTFEILAKSSPFIPSFGSHIELNEEATRAYVPTRSGDNLVVLEVAEAPGRGAGSLLHCVDAEGRRTMEADACALHRIPDLPEAPELTRDPFGVEVVTVERGGVPVDVVALSYLSGDLVSVASFPEQQIAGASLVSAPLLRGGNQIARRPGTLEMYVAGRNTNQIVVFTPFIDSSGEAEAIFIRRTITLNTGVASVDARGIAFDETGEYLYVTTRRPSALHIFRLRPGALGDGSGLEHQLERTIPLGKGPSDVRVHRVPGGEGRELVLVPCFDDKNIHIIDPKRGVVEAIVELDETPYELITESGTARCQEPGSACRAYVSLFTDSSKLSVSCDDTGEGCGSVAVIDLDPASDRYLQVIAKIR